MASITVYYKFTETDPLNLPRALKALEKDILGLALYECKNVKTRAAKLLKLNRTTLIEKMRKHKIPFSPVKKRKQRK